MRKPFHAFLALSLLASVTAAHDDGESPWYLDLAIGTVSADAVTPPGAGEVGFDAGVLGALSVGRTLGHTGAVTWAVEGELFYSYFKLDEGDLETLGGIEEQAAQATAWMLNLEADVRLTSDVSLYAGAGIGFASDITFDSFNAGAFDQVDEDGVATQFQLGLRYKLGTDYDVSLGYRYFATEDVEVANLGGGSSDVEFVNQAFELGFRWGL